MPGLSFLNKKSFHTTNVKNVEKVWLAEKKAEEEQKRLAELQKQLQEERQILELRQLQAAQGQVTKTIDNSLDWMYEGPMSSAQRQQTSEEYLLGKIYNAGPDHSKSSILSNAQNGDSKAPAKWLSKVASKNDSFARAHEDPFIAIKQEENKRREKVINNPIKMGRIKEKIEAELEEKEREKRMKKQAKQEKKEMKKAAKRQRKEASSSVKRERTSSSSDSSSESEPEGKGKAERPAAATTSAAHSEEHRRNRSRSRSPPRSNRPDTTAHRDERGAERDQFRRDDSDRHRNTDGEFRNRDRSSDRHQNSGRDADRSRDRDAQYRRREDSRDRPTKRPRDDSRERRYVREDSRDRRDRKEKERREDTHERERRRSPSPRRPDREARGTKRERSRSGSGDRRDRNDNDRSPPRERPRYGLLRAPGADEDAGASSTRPRSTHLGPNPELLRRKEEAERKAEAERRNRTRADLSTLTDEERARRIQAMQADADYNDALRANRLAVKQSARDSEEQSGNAAFLQSMRKEVYSSGTADMAKRIDQNKHSRQSSADIDSAEGFLRK